MPLTKQALGDAEDALQAALEDFAIETAQDAWVEGVEEVLSLMFDKAEAAAIRLELLGDDPADV